MHNRDLNAAVNVLVYERRNRVREVEGETPAEVLRRPMKRQPLEDHSRSRWAGVGELRRSPIEQRLV